MTKATINRKKLRLVYDKPKLPFLTTDLPDRVVKTLATKSLHSNLSVILSVELCKVESELLELISKNY